MIWIVGFVVVGFLFSVGCCCACAAPCLQCDDEEIEALGINVTIAGLVPAAPFFCNCDAFNGTWHVPFHETLDNGRRCDFTAEFDFNYCGNDGELQFHVSLGCWGTNEHFVGVSVSFDGSFVADALVLTDGKLPCDFANLDMSPVSWQILCDASNATITLAAA